MNKELVSKVNAALANVGVEYVKLHNLHWNVTGMNFKEIHEYLESQYDYFAELFDSLAEFLRKNDELPLASMKDFLGLATIKEIESREVSSKEALEIYLGDLQLLQSQAVELHQAAEKESDFALAAMMEELLSNYSKTLWFVKSMLK